MNTTKYLTNSTDLTNSRGKFIVGSFSDQQGFSFSVNPVTHDNSAQARAECTRLAKLNPGKTFVFVQLCGGEHMLPRPTTVSF